MLKKVPFIVAAALLTANVAGAMPVLPDVSSATFSNSLAISNPFFPLTPGTLYVYEAESEEEGAFRLETLVTNEVRVVQGVETRVVFSREFVDGLKVEETRDWFAQDDAGNVWYFGEDTTAFEYDDDGLFIGSDNEGAWEAGENGAMPGFIMEASPTVGDNYYQEFAPADEAVDQAIVTSLTRAVTTELGDFEDVLETLEFTELEPDALENKLYAAGIGLILVEEGLDEDGVPSFAIPLISVSSVPEPGTAVLLALGLAGLGCKPRRSQSAP